MFKKVKNWQMFAMVTVISFLSLLLIQHYVIAAWQNPIGNPGDFVAGRIVFNPVTEDIDLQGSYITDSTLGDPSNLKKGVISAEGCPSSCIYEGVVMYAETENSSGYAFKGVNIQGEAAAYFQGKVGIGQADHPVHLLDIVSLEADDNAEINIQSGDNDYWGIYDDKVSNELRFWNTNVSGDANALIIDNSGNVEINNGYLQIDTTTLVPAAGDCDATTIGRMIVNVANNRLYVCSGTVLGGISWKYTALAGVGF